jgi:hypothetical protein
MTSSVLLICPSSAAVKIGRYNAYISHQGQPQQTRPEVVCHKCLEPGHFIFNCENESLNCSLYMCRISPPLTFIIFLICPSSADNGTIMPENYWVVYMLKNVWCLNCTR